MHEPNLYIKKKWLEITKHPSIKLYNCCLGLQEVVFVGPVEPNKHPAQLLIQVTTRRTCHF